MQNEEGLRDLVNIWRVPAGESTVTAQHHNRLLATYLALREQHIRACVLIDTLGAEKEILEAQVQRMRAELARLRRATEVTT